MKSEAFKYEGLCMIWPLSGNDGDSRFKNLFHNGREWQSGTGRAISVRF
jgi:hypothetical protein